MNSDWLIWQLADSAFPAGALAHSSGLEAAVQSGLVTDGDSTRDFVATVLRQLHRGVGVYPRLVWQQPEQLPQHDMDCDLFLNSTVANRASRAQGKAFLSTAAQTFDVDALKMTAADLRRQRHAGHLAPVFGLVCRSLAIDLLSTDRLFAFITARSSLSAAVRLGVIGPLEAQRIQAKIANESTTHNDTPVQTAPFLDLLQSTQDRLYSRLFQS